MRNISPFIATVLLSAALTACKPPSATTAQETATENTAKVSADNNEKQTSAPIPIKVVVVTMFETGADSGDKAGEFQRWYERRKLNTVFPAPHMHHDIQVNLETGVMGIVTGMGTANSSAALMALGLDSRFDLSKAYWLVAGIAGFDPQDASLGSAAWAEYLVDGDLAHEIDPREMPEDWDTGIFPLFSKGPYDPNKHESLGEVFKLNGELTDWAYNLTKDITLSDNPELEKTRKLYVDHANAQKKPFVLKGDNVAAMTFFHGALLNDWANKWVSYWTDGKGSFVSSAMEDTGSFQSLSYLDKLGKVDKNRVMVLRTASNYTMQPAGKTAAENLLQEQHDSYAGLDVALENAYLTGSVVVDEILTHWDKYQDTVPKAIAAKN
jgi:purine nucleoside permease